MIIVLMTLRSLFNFMAVGHWVYRHTSHWNLVKLVKMQCAGLTSDYFSAVEQSLGGHNSMILGAGCWSEFTH